MTLFKYKAINEEGKEVGGSIEAVSRDVAINAIQNRGLVISSIASAEKKSLLQYKIGSGVKPGDVVILSRQISTLFEAQVSALKVFSLLAAESENKHLRSALNDVSEDLKGGSSISQALSKHPKIFSEFYVNMVKVGEESGKLDQIFQSLADHLDRTYEIGAKARNALIYPAFVVFTFITVMVLMLTTVIPKISSILEESGGEIPIYTRAIMSVSNFLVDYGIFLLILIVVGLFVLWRQSKTEKGKLALSRYKLSVPYIGNLYRKLYLSRISDNMQTMLLAGIPMVSAIESTSDVVGNEVYKNILLDASKAVRAGDSMSTALSNKDEIPSIMVQMMKIGEETGELGNILSTLGKFYRREVNNAVDTLVGLIEPVLIVSLAVGVGVLLAAVLVPIYNISGAI